MLLKNNMILILIYWLQQIKDRDNRPEEKKYFGKSFVMLASFSCAVLAL